MPNNVEQMTAAGLRLAGLQETIAPNTIALVGASARNRELVANVQRSGAVAFGVHPTAAEVDGLRCVPGLGALPEVPELAVMAVGPGAIVALVREAILHGVRAFVVPGLGAEAGEDAQNVAAELAGLADVGGAAILGRNCMGIAVPGGASAWLGTLPSTFHAGGVAIVSQSGSIADAFVALGPRFGYTGVVSVGAETNRDVADWVGHFAGDPRTRVIGLFLETVRRPDAFRAALRTAADAGKPVVCLKVGRSDKARRAALAHSGAIVGSHAAFVALLRTHGVLEVDDLPAMIELLDVLCRRRRPGGLRIGAVTESGAEAALLGDHAEPLGFTFPDLAAGAVEALRERLPKVPVTNPIDPWALGDPIEAFTQSLQALADSNSYDVLLGQVDLSRHRGPAEQSWCAAVVRTLARLGDERGLFTAVTTVHQSDPPDELARFADEHDVCTLKGIGAGLTAIARAARWAPLAHGPGDPGDLTPDLAKLLAELPDGALSEHASSDLLEQLGVRFARRALADTPHAAGEVAVAIGFPVVVKLDGPAHKARAGGVVLDLDDRAAVVEAVSRFGRSVLVAEQLPAGEELFCGMAHDPDYGPVYAVGHGGGDVEARRPVALLGPLSELVAMRAIAEAGLERWSAPLTATLLAMDALARASARVVEIDVNPLIGDADGDARAVDALVVLASSSAGSPA